MILLKARAKINLFFQITGKRNDNYHLIESLVVFADDIYDIIKVTPAEKNFTEVMGGEFAYLLHNEKNNLIDKALEYFTSDTKYHCQLTKNIPVAAGLGGGSSDAAAIAKFLHAPQNDILTKIGADLPVCYYNQPAFCSGIGEIIEPIENLPSLHLVLVNPNKTLLTKDVFQNKLQINTPTIAHKPIDFANNADKTIKFLQSLNNDLTTSAITLLPEIQTILNLLASQKGCQISRMSGSGPTCFGIFNDKNSAINASKIISRMETNYWVKYTKI